MIKKTWKKALAGLCAAAMVMTSISWPAMSVNAQDFATDWLKCNGRDVKLTVKYGGDGNAVAGSHTGGQNSDAGDLSLVFDGNTSTGVNFRNRLNGWGGNLKVGDYIQVDFRVPTDLKSINFTFTNDNNTFGRNSVLEYTTDGVSWKLLKGFGGPNISTASYAESVEDVKAVRLVNGIEKGNVFVNLREISFEYADPIAYYSFDNITDTTLVDECGNHNGTIADSATIVDGKLGKALLVNEAAMGATVADYDTYDDRNWSVAYWVKTTSEFNKEISVLEDAEMKYSLSLKMADGKDSGFRVGDGSDDILSAAYNFSKDTWYHMAWTQNKTSGGYTMYVNGTAIKTNGWTVGNTIKAPLEVIGGTGFTGLIDEVRVYDYALSADEVAELANVDPTEQSVELKKFDVDVLNKNAKANSWYSNHDSDGPASWAFDNNESTIWHSNYGTTTNENKNGNVNTTNPIWIQTGFDKIWEVKEVIYSGRGANNIKDYTLEVAVLDDPLAEPDENTVWTEVANGKTGLGTNAGTYKIVLDDFVRATHIRLNSKSTDTGNGYIAAKEISIYGKDIALADYSGVEAALKKVPADMSLYTDETAAALNHAVEAVKYGKDYTKQEEVDAMAVAITEAIDALVLRPANYSAVEAAITAANALKKDNYTNFSAVEDAIKAVVQGLDITKQAEVDAMAAAITAAIDALEMRKYTTDAPFVFPNEVGESATLEAEFAYELINVDGNPQWQVNVAEGDWAENGYYLNYLDDDGDIAYYAFNAPCKGKYSVALKYNSGSSVNSVNWSTLNADSSEGVITSGDSGTVPEGTGTVTFEMTVEKAGAGILVLTPGSGKAPQMDSLTITLLPPKAEFKEASASLTGTIGLNFYVQVNDAEELDNLSVRLTSSKVGSNPIVKALNGITAVKSGSRAGWYKVTYNVAAKEMTDVITAEILHNGAVVATVTESVKTYATKLQKSDKVKEELGEEKFGKLSALLNAMLNYGSAAQYEFKYKDNEEGLPTLESLKGLYENTVINPDVDFVEDTDTKTAMSITRGEGFDTKKVDLSQVSLLLKEDTVLRLYLNVASGVDLSKYTVTPALKEGKKYTEVKNISAQNLEDRITFTITAPDGTMATVVYSPLDYAKAVVNSSDTDDTLKTVAKALYEYYVCAETYFN